MAGKRQQGLKDTEASHMEFINENKDALVDMAVKGYEAEGRGAVVCWKAMPAPRALWSKAQLHGRRNLPGFTQAAYISDTAARASGIGWPDATAARMVGDYDPDRQFMVIITRADGKISAYKLRVVPLPDEGGSANPTVN